MLLESAAGFRQWHIRYQYLCQWQQLTRRRLLLRVCFFGWKKIPCRIRCVRTRRYFVIWKRRRYADLWLRRLTMGFLHRVILIWRIRTLCERTILKTGFNAWTSGHKRISAAMLKSTCFYALMQQKKVMIAWTSYHRKLAGIGNLISNQSRSAAKARYWKRIRLICRARWCLRTIQDGNLIKSYWLLWTRYRKSLFRKADGHFQSTLTKKALCHWKYCHDIYRAVFKVIVLDHSIQMKSALYLWRLVAADRRSLRYKAFQLWRLKHLSRLIQDRVRFRICYHSFYSWQMLCQRYVHFRMVFAAFQKWKLNFGLRQVERRFTDHLRRKVFADWLGCWMETHQWKKNCLAATSLHRKLLLAKFQRKWMQTYIRSNCLRQLIYRFQLKVKVQFFAVWNQSTIKLLSISKESTSCQIDQNQSADSNDSKFGSNLDDEKEAVICSEIDPLAYAMSRHHYRLTRERACFRNWIYYCHILRFYRRTATRHNRHNAIIFLINWRTQTILQRKCLGFRRNQTKIRYWHAWGQLSKHFRKARLFTEKKRLHFHLRRWRQTRLRKLHSLQTIFYAWRQLMSRRWAMNKCKAALARRVLRQWISTRKLKKFIIRRHFRIWMHTLKHNSDLIFKFLVRLSQKRKQSILSLWHRKIYQSANELKRKYVVIWHRKLHRRRKDRIEQILTSWSSAKRCSVKQASFNTWMRMSRIQSRLRQLRHIQNMSLKAISLRAMIRLRTSFEFNRRSNFKRSLHIWRKHFSMKVVFKHGEKILQKWFLDMWRAKSDQIRDVHLRQGTLNLHFKKWQRAFTTYANSRQIALKHMNQVLSEMKAIRRLFRYAIVFNRIRLYRWIFSAWKRCLINEQTTLACVALDFVRRKCLSRWWQRYIDVALNKRWHKLNKCIDSTTGNEREC